MRLDQRFERRIVERIRSCTGDKSTRRTKASGALDFEKGDAKHRVFHIECKHSMKDFITVQWSWWQLCCKQAEAIGKIPCLAIGFGNSELTCPYIFIVPHYEGRQFPLEIETWKPSGSHRVFDLKSQRTVLWNDEKLDFVNEPKENWYVQPVQA